MIEKDSDVLDFAIQKLFNLLCWVTVPLCLSFHFYELSFGLIGSTSLVMLLLFGISKRLAYVSAEAKKLVHVAGNEPGKVYHFVRRNTLEK